MYGQFYNPYAYQIPPQAQDMGQYRPQMQQQPVMQPVQDERIWVQGESSAQAYLVAPNSFVRLWDSTRPVFYEKRADASGKPSIVAYEYHSNNAQCPDNEQNNTMVNSYDEQINSLNERINALEERMAEYEQSYDDDTAVPEVPERVQRKSTAGSRKVSERR